MLKTSKFSGLELSNIPHINLRTEFQEVCKRFDDPRFLDLLRNWRPGVGIAMPTYAWLSSQHTLYTLVLQQAILGVESYLPGAVMFELGMANRLTQEVARQVQNPYSIKADERAGTAKRYYVLLPSLVSRDIELEKLDPVLWSRVKAFYREVRNPIFHGAQLKSDDPETVLPAIQLIKDIYGWIDGWHPPDAFFQAINGA